MNVLSVYGAITVSDCCLPVTDPCVHPDPPRAVQDVQTGARVIHHRRVLCNTGARVSTQDDSGVIEVIILSLLALMH